jgi:hypothetical protein
VCWGLSSLLLLREAHLANMMGNSGALPPAPGSHGTTWVLGEYKWGVFLISCIRLTRIRQVGTKRWLESRHSETVQAVKCPQGHFHPKLHGVDMHRSPERTLACEITWLIRVTAGTDSSCWMCSVSCLSEEFIWSPGHLRVLA